jgi:hypothetical protein
MYGGVSVQRLLPNLENGFAKTQKERRTLWLMLPEVGALRLGFVSKLSDGEGAISNKSSTQRATKRDAGDYSLPGWEGDMATVASEEVTLDSALLEKVRFGGVNCCLECKSFCEIASHDTILLVFQDTSSGQIRTGDVQLSHKHSVALTDVTVLSQQSNVSDESLSNSQMQFPEEPRSAAKHLLILSLSL